MKNSQKTAVASSSSSHRSTFFDPPAKKKKLSNFRSDNSSSSQVPCPVCGMCMMASSVSAHLDRCLVQQEHKTQQSSSAAGSSATAAMTVSSAAAELDIFEHSTLPGLWLIPNFVNDDEELEIAALLENDAATPWHHSTFNGHCLSKVFGVRTQFGGYEERERLVRVNEISKGEHDMPAYLLPLVERVRDVIQHAATVRRKPVPKVLQQFRPNECNVNCYLKSEGHHLTPHYDDRFLSGPILMNLSLCGDSKMTYSRADSELEHDLVGVDLPRRCLQLVTGKARYNYKHRIRQEDLFGDKRISVTFRRAGSSTGGLIRGLQGSNVPSISSFLSAAAPPAAKVVDASSSSSSNTDKYS